MKRLLPWAIAAVALSGLLLYYALAILLDGAFALPVHHAWKVPANGGTIVVRGVSEVGFGAESVEFEATFHPAHPATGPDEPIGTWRGDQWNPVAYAVGAAIVFLPDASHPFVRTGRGRWMALPIEAAAREGADTNTITTTGYRVRHVSPETRELIVDRDTLDGRLARFVLRLSVDGEQLTPMRRQDAQAPRSP